MNLIEASQWADEMDIQVTVCDLQAKIVYMNKASVANFEKRGGQKLIGTSLYDCHNQHSNELIRKMLETPQTMVFEINSGGRKKIIRETPWIENGEHKGIIEIGFYLPEE